MVGNKTKKKVIDNNLCFEMISYIYNFLIMHIYTFPILVSAIKCLVIYRIYVCVHIFFFNITLAF